MERKFTDDEIVKALGCCGRENCRGCPYRNGICHQGNPMIRDARDLIIRQKAEVERLTNGCSNCPVVQRKSEIICELHEQIEYWQRGYNDIRRIQLSQQKTEAIKELAAIVNEKLQNLARMHMQHGSDEIYFLVSESFIDNVLKELTEEKK